MRDKYAPVIEGFDCDRIINPWSFQCETFYEDGGNGGTMLDGTTIQDVLAVKNRFSWALNVLTMAQYNALISALALGSEPDTVSAYVYDPTVNARYTTTFHVTLPAFQFVFRDGAMIAIADGLFILEDTGAERAVIRVIASGEGWILTSDGLLDVHFTGDIPDYSSDTLWQNYRAQITSVEISDSVISIGIFAFYAFNSMSSVTIPDSVTSIGNGAFQNCTALTNVTIPDSVTSIGQGMFDGCRRITSVTIPDSVTSIGANAFYNCESLAGITIPDGVTSIGNYAFCGCQNLISITLPRNITSIPEGIFRDSGLTDITIPASVTSIESYAFYECGSLSDVYYGGTETQWNALAIGNYNTPLTSATIHYNSTGST